MKTVNGNPNILTPEQEQQRLQIVDLELKARYWEAQWKIRFYTLEAEALQPKYEEYLEIQKKAQEEALRKFQEQIEAMNKKAKEDAEKKAGENIVQDNKEFLDKLTTV